jgi:hypothetical protein
MQEEDAAPDITPKDELPAHFNALTFCHICGRLDHAKCQKCGDDSCCPWEDEEVIRKNNGGWYFCSNDCARMFFYD